MIYGGVLAIRYMANRQIDEGDVANTGDRTDTEMKGPVRRRVLTDGGSEAVVGDQNEIDPNELEGHQKNWEIYGDDSEIEGMVTDMENEGYDRANPLTINPEWTVIKGHRRWKAALEAGIDAVPVIEREFASEEDEEAALLLDNLLQRSQTFSQKMREATELERINDEYDSGTGARTEIVNEFLDSSEGRTRDQIAAAVDLGSGETYRRAKRVWEAAESGDDEAAEQVRLIDTGEQSIHGAFTHLQDDTGADSDVKQSEEDDGGATEDGTVPSGRSNIDSSDSDGATDETVPSATENAGTSAVGESGADTTDPDVTDENPPASAELDDRDDPTEEMGMGRSEGGGAGEDASKSPAEIADDDEDGDTDATTPINDDSEASSMGERDEDGGAVSDETPTVDEDEQVVSVEDFVIEGEMAEQVRERAAGTDQSPDELLDDLISDGQIETDQSQSEDELEDENDEDEISDGDDDTDGVLVTLDGNEDELRSRARELNLEPDEVVNRLVGAWLEGDEAPFEMAG